MKDKLLVLAYHPIDNPIGGSFVYTNEILKRRKCKVLIYDSSPSVILEGDEIHEYNIPQCIYKIQNFNFAVSRIIEWVYVIIKLSYELIKNGKNVDRIWIPYAEFFPLTLTGLIGSILYKQKLICTIHQVTVPSEFERIRTSFGKLYPVYPLIFKLLKILIQRSDVTTTVSKHVSNKLYQYVDKKFSIISPGIDLDEINSANTTGKKYDAIYIGRLVEEKGIFELLGVWNTICKKHSTAKLALMGSSKIMDMIKIEKFIKDQNLEENIDLLGPIYTNEKYQILKSSNLFIILSREESWCISAVEALACGTPVVAYSIDGLEESIGRYEGAHLINKEDKKKLVSTIEKLILTPTRYEGVTDQDWGDKAIKFWGLLNERQS